MKKLLPCIISIFLLSVSLSSCKKDNKVTPVTPTNYLTKSTWTISNVDLQNADGTWTSLIEVPSNLAGETIIFTASGTCNDDPFTGSLGNYKWSLTTNQLIVASTTYSLVTLNADIMQLVLPGEVTLTSSSGSSTYVATRLTYNHLQ